MEEARIILGSGSDACHEHVGKRLNDRQAARKWEERPLSRASSTGQATDTGTDSAASIERPRRARFRTPNRRTPEMTEPGSKHPLHNELSEPVAMVAALGADDARGASWPEYLEFGLGDEHVPELIRLATAEPGPEEDDEVDDAVFWTRIHAMRALGRLGADEAVEPLVALLRESDELSEDRDEIPIVLGMIGGEAVAPLRRLLDDPEIDDRTRDAAADGLVEVAQRDADARDDAVAAIVTRLGDYGNNSPELNAFLIGRLLDLKLVAAAPLIKEVMDAGVVDVSINGDWEDIQIELGLLERRLTPSPHARQARAPTPKQKQKTGNKRKMATASRKKNRKRR
jgi:hypothetical protein